MTDTKEPIADLDAAADAWASARIDLDQARNAGEPGALERARAALRAAAGRIKAAADEAIASMVAG